MAEQEVKAQGASLNTMFTYGIGSMAVGIKNNLLGTFLLIYLIKMKRLASIKILIIKIWGKIFLIYLKIRKRDLKIF